MRQRELQNKKSKLNALDIPTNYYAPPQKAKEKQNGKLTMLIIQIKTIGNAVWCRKAKMYVLELKRNGNFVVFLYRTN